MPSISKTQTMVILLYDIFAAPAQGVAQNRYLTNISWEKEGRLAANL